MTTIMYQLIRFPPPPPLPSQTFWNNIQFRSANAQGFILEIFQKAKRPLGWVKKLPVFGFSPPSPQKNTRFLKPKIENWRPIFDTFCHLSTHHVVMQMLKWQDYLWWHLQNLQHSSSPPSLHECIIFCLYFYVFLLRCCNLTYPSSHSVYC